MGVGWREAVPCIGSAASTAISTIRFETSPPTASPPKRYIFPVRVEYTAVASRRSGISKDANRVVSVRGSNTITVLSVHRPKALPPPSR
jgi:hypothetical protein